VLVTTVVLIVMLASSALPWQAARRPAAPKPFKTTLTVEQMTGKQAVVQTTMGSFVIDLRPDLAPNHVGYFMKMAGDGAYANTLFHRVVKNGIIQGGDPLTKDASKAAQFGTGDAAAGHLQREAAPHGFDFG